MDKVTIIYIAAMGGVALILLVVLRVLFHRAEQRRREEVEDLKRFVAVKTPMDHPRSAKEAKAEAVESIATRFAVMRRITIPIVLVLFGLLIGVPFYGRMPTAVITLLVTAATIVLGIAAKPVLENVIAGIMVSFAQPLRIGDLVSIYDNYAVVEQINLTYTIFKLWDFRRFVVSNSRLIQTEYFNYTVIDKWLWATVKFRVAHDADLELVERIALQSVKDSPRCGQYTPGFWFVSMDRDSIECWLAGWVEHPLEAWGVRHSLAKRLVLGFRKHNIRTHIHQIETHPAGAPPAPPERIPQPGPPAP